MRNKRFLTALLAVALTLSLALPAGAASSFSDVTDPATAVNADILRLMGVVDGVGDGRFHPQGSLTRAEFCTMVVNFMQKGDQVPLHATRTIFSDVTASHWALGYVNLAASIRVKDGDRELALISGVGDGTFAPDEKITLAQATTILIRVLGYTSKEAGAVWPQSYMNLASSIGLTKGVSAGTNDTITRAQAAQLFVNALGCRNAAGTEYYKSLGTVKEKAIILAVDVKTDDGSSDGAIRTSVNKGSEAYLAAAGKVKPAALLGKRGSLVLNSKNEIISFVPDNSRATSVILAGDAQPSYVKGTDGQQYTMSQDTILYTGGEAEGKEWVKGYSALLSGTPITMYSENGKIVAVYAGGTAGTSHSDAVVVRGTASTALFHSLTGGATDFAIRKNRQNIALSDIKPYDVVTYDSLNNTLLVSDLQLTCVYEAAAPNAQAPTSITVLGHTFPVLDSAWEMTQGIRLGDIVTLLLTEDGKVAGMTKADSQIRSTAIGMISGSGVDLYLPNGGSIKLSGTMSAGAASLTDQLVNISSSSKGQINLSKMSAPSRVDTLDLSGRKLDHYPISAGVRVYEQVDGSAMVKIDLSSLEGITALNGRVAAYHLNSSNMVDYLVLDAVTGDAYTYGQMLSREATTEGGGDTQAWSLRCGGGTIDFASQSTYTKGNGSFAGIVAGKNSLNEPTIRSVVELRKIEKVSPANFFVSQGVEYVSVAGQAYRVADGVQCGRAMHTSSVNEVVWFTEASGADRLAACKAFSSDLTIYVDPIAQRVRVVVAN